MSAAPDFLNHPEQVEQATHANDPGFEVIEGHAATCAWRQQDPPLVWRSRWDWYPPACDDPLEPFYDHLLPREASRLFALYDDHDKTCPQARDALDDIREQDYGMSRERTQCPHTADLRLTMSGYADVDPNACTRPRPPEPLAGVQVLSDMTVAPPAELLLGRLSSSHTVLYGDGEMGKGTLASKWIAQATRDEGHTVLLLDYETHPDEWNQRIRMLGGVAERVRYVSPNTVGWAGAVWDHIDAITEAAEDVCLLVIDSVSQACVGADPKDDETATRYGAAIQQVARPVLSLAHVTKSGESRWPYGSIFWHNLARVTWHLSRVPGGRLLRCKKANAHKRPPPQLVKLAEYHDRWDLSETPQQEALLDKALRILEDGPLSLAELVDLMNEEAEDDDDPVKTDSVKKALQREQRKPEPLVAYEDGLWTRL